MKKYKTHTVTQYLNALARKAPVPGGGSAAALAGAMGAALISMVANYSKGRNSSKTIERQLEKISDESEAIRKRFIELIDLDAEAYLKVVKARKGTEKEKKKARQDSQRVPLEVCHLCYQSIDLTPELVKKGNPHLVSDIEVASEMLLASFNSALATLKA